MEKVKKNWLCIPDSKQQKLRKQKATNTLQSGQELAKVGSGTSWLKVPGFGKG